MKVKALVLALAGALALSATAQEVSNNYVDNTAGKNVSFAKNKGSDNWFISLQGGASIIEGFSRVALQKEATFVNRLGYTGAIGFGKWHNPYFGTRLSIDYNYFKDGYAGLDGDKLQAGHSLNPHFDFMFNMSNYFGVYRANRVFNFVPFVGVGYMGNQIIVNTPEGTKKYWDAKNFNHSVSGNAGVELQFRMGRRVSLVLAPQVTFANMLHAKRALAHRNSELIGQVRLGLTFDAGRPDFDAVVPMDEALLNDLQGQVNRLKAENMELAKRPKECPTVSPQTIVKEVPVKEIERHVFFRLDSSKVDRNQMPNIFAVAEFAKANNLPVIVVGYADVKTGNPNYNMSISERRAREVARLLTDEYGVPSNLVTIEYKGDMEQPFTTNAWNRVVIMTAK